MKKDMFSGTTKKNSKLTAYKELVSVSKVCSFSKLMQNNPVSKRIKLAFAENEDLEKETYQKEDCDNVVFKTAAFSLPTQIRIRATDGEGNTIEVTY